MARFGFGIVSDRSWCLFGNMKGGNGMKGFRALILVIAIGVLVFPVIAAAQEPNVPMEAGSWAVDSTSAVATFPGMSAEDALPNGAGGAFGGQSQDYWIAANEFLPVDGNAAYSYYTFHTYYLESADNPYIMGHIDLPAGARMTSLACYVYDADAVNNVSWTLQRSYFVYGTWTPTYEDLVTKTQDTSGGFYELWTSMDVTILYRDGDERNMYQLRVELEQGTSALRLFGCRAFWHRTVSPAPASATFGDVGTGHWAFRFVEALADSGITAGCGGGNFCPDGTVTRAEMAVFLSAALGLHYPY
jgi:hypothetical protein